VNISRTLAEMTGSTNTSLLPSSISISTMAVSTVLDVFDANENNSVSDGQEVTQLLLLLTDFVSRSTMYAGVIKFI